MNRFTPLAVLLTTIACAACSTLGSVASETAAVFRNYSEPNVSSPHSLARFSVPRGGAFMLFPGEACSNPKNPESGVVLNPGLNLGAAGLPGQQRGMTGAAVPGGDVTTEVRLASGAPVTVRYIAGWGKSGNNYTCRTEQSMQAEAGAQYEFVGVTDMENSRCGFVAFKLMPGPLLVPLQPAKAC